MEKTYFISFEGIDGCGKDTQLQNLATAIKEDDNYPFGNKYSNIWITREPSHMTASGKEIAKLIRERDVSAQEAAKLYVQDRKEHTVFIKDVLSHSHVLTSRYDVSTLVYQMTQGMDFEELYDMHNYEVGECIAPDLSIIFELDADIAFARTKSRNSVQECFEKIEFQRKLVDIQKQVIEKLEQKGRKIILVNANQPIADVTKQMLEKISKALNN